MELENKIINELEKNNNIEIEQKNFLNNTITNIINNTLDVGLRVLLPDLIENQVIDIKNALLENGIKAGINEAIKSVMELAKSVQGIFTGKFESVEQVNYAITKGGIIDTISKLIDFAADKAYNLNLINKSINSLIKQGKNIILSTLTNKIEEELEKQNNYINIIETNIENWKKEYTKKDFIAMDESYNNIHQQIEKVIPIENLIKEVSKIEIMHNLIKNNNHNFNLSDLELEVINRLN